MPRTGFCGTEVPAPCAGRESALVVAARSAGTCPRRRAARARRCRRSAAAAGAVFDAKAFGADARRDGQFHDDCGLARGKYLGVAPLLDLTQRKPGRCSRPRARPCRERQADGLRRRGMQRRPRQLTRRAVQSPYSSSQPFLGEKGTMPRRRHPEFTGCSWLLKPIAIVRGEAVWSTVGENQSCKTEILQCDPGIATILGEKV